jgi:O-antigen/teichoic acid export membrane protein
MTRRLSTWVNRFQIILLGGVARLLAALFTVTVSLIVIRTQSSQLWGEVVPLMLVLEFGFTIIGWGALPYLIQQFSLHPHTRKNDWSQSAVSRSGLLLAFLLLIAFLPRSVDIKLGLMIWATGRYVYQCFEPIAQVERNFVFSIFLEISALLVMVAPVFLLSTPLSVTTLVNLFAASMIWRAVVSLIYYWQWIRWSAPKVSYFKTSMPFFLLAISGVLQQRTDLYCVAYFLPETETASYQVYFNFLIFCQFLASLLLSPFAKNIFRLRPASLRSLEKTFVLAGIPLSLISLLAVAFMITFVYRLEITFFQYALGYIYVLMFYVYLLRNYELGKTYRQGHAALLGFIASGVNLILCIFLIPVYHITGALLAGTIAQVVVAVLYRRWADFGYARR